MLLNVGNGGCCVFDYDDTIMQTRQCKMSAIIELGRQMFDREIRREDIEKHWGIAHHRLFEAVFGVSGATLEEAMSRYARMDDAFPLIPHPEAKAALERLQAVSRLIIVSSCERGLIERQWAASPLSAIRLARIYGCSDTRHHKPSGKVFMEMLVEFPDLGADNVVYIGDGIKDLQAADEAGLPFLGVDRSDAETAAISAAGGRMFPSLTAIADHLLRATDAD